MSDMAAAPPPPPAMPAASFGPVGKVRNPLVVLLLSIVTLGIYGLVWTYSVFKELKEHTGDGLGGPVGLILTWFTGLGAFFMCHEIGNMYAKAGKEKPVTWLTVFWNLIPIAGSIIYIYKVQGALNRRWSGEA